MADIVQSLFGLTPEAYRQQQANEASRMALGYAQLTPQQRASFGAARAGYQLGEVLGGALGGQDPMLQMISNRQAIARQIDPTNIESMTAGIQALNQAGDTVGAMQLTQVLRQMQSEMAQRTQREAAAQASLAAARASEAEARRKGITDAELKAGRRAELARLLARPGELSAEDIQAFQIENRALMSKEELEAEEAARQTRAFTGGVPAQPAMAQPMAVQPAAPAAEPAAAQPAAAQPAAPTTDIQGQLQQKFQQLEFALQFPSSPQAKARADVLRKEIEDLQLRGRQVSETQKLRDRAEQDALAQNLVPGTPEFTASVNRYIAAGAPEALRAERQNTEYRTWRDKNLDIFQAPSPSLSLEQQLEVRQTALSRVTQQPTAESIAGKSDQEFLKNEIAALRERIKEGRQASEERNSLSSSMFNGRRFSELTPAEKERVNARILREKKDISKAGANITVQETEFAKKLGGVQANIYEGAVATRNNARSAIQTVQRMTELNDQGLISGAFATGRTGLTNFLDTAGLLSEADKSKLARSQEYQKVAGDAVLAALGGRLGAGFSNEDRKFIQSLVPQLETSALARRRLLEFMDKKNREIFNESQRLITYAETNRSLNGFVPRVPLPDEARPSGVRGLTDEQLREQLRRLRQEGK